MFFHVLSATHLFVDISSLFRMLFVMVNNFLRHDLICSNYTLNPQGSFGCINHLFVSLDLKSYSVKYLWLENYVVGSWCRGNRSVLIRIQICSINPLPRLYSLRQSDSSSSFINPISNVKSFKQFNNKAKPLFHFSSLMTDLQTLEPYSHYIILGSNQIKLIQQKVIISILPKHLWPNAIPLGHHHLTLLFLSH